jgi:signal peptidase II
MRLLWITAGTSMVAGIVGAWLTEMFLDQRIAILGSFAGLQRSHNPGIAFGVDLPPVLQEVLIGIALILVIAAALRTAHTSLSQAGFGLIVGGAVANIVDRLGDGLVTDVFQVGSFPIFNVADSCITIGVTLLLLETMRNKASKI